MVDTWATVGSLRPGRRATATSQRRRRPRWRARTAPGQPDHGHRGRLLHRCPVRGGRRVSSSSQWQRALHGRVHQRLHPHHRSHHRRDLHRPRPALFRRRPRLACQGKSAPRRLARPERSPAPSSSSASMTRTPGPKPPSTSCCAIDRDSIPSAARPGAHPLPLRHAKADAGAQDVLAAAGGEELGFHVWRGCPSTAPHRTCSPAAARARAASVLCRAYGCGAGRARPPWSRRAVLRRSCMTARSVRSRRLRHEGRHRRFRRRRGGRPARDAGQPSACSSLATRKALPPTAPSRVLGLDGRPMGTCPISASSASPPTPPGPRRGHQDWPPRQPQRPPHGSTAYAGAMSLIPNKRRQPRSTASPSPFWPSITAAPLDAGKRMVRTEPASSSPASTPGNTATNVIPASRHRPA